MDVQLRDHRTKRIVVAVDESEESMHALSWCLSHLLPSKAILLLLLYVKPPPPPIYSFFDAAGYLLFGDASAKVHKLGTRMVRSVMERAEAVCSDFNHDVCVERFVGTGDAQEVICKAVDKLRADTLVMGCHGYGFMKRALLGRRVLFETRQVSLGDRQESVIM